MIGPLLLLLSGFHLFTYFKYLYHTPPDEVKNSLMEAHSSKQFNQSKYTTKYFSPLSFPSYALRGMWKTQTQAPFLRWNASRCEQIHQCVSPTEILRWWMDLMDWFKPQLPLLTDWITEWMLQQITSAAGERIYSVHFRHSWVHPSLMADCCWFCSQGYCVCFVIS